jgi:ATP-dependent helicase/nuclease subunit B
LNPQAFGEMIHAALQALAADPAARAETDAAMVAAFLGAHAERWVRARYGAAPALPVLIQLEAARQRLTAAAQQQVALLAEGWDIVASELSIKGQVEGLTVSGRIDRVDRQRATQAIRILDYKTSEKAVDPAQAHLAPPLEDAPDYAVAALEKPQRWKDLQLPLYRRLLAEQPEYRGSCEVGYFNLPKAVSETGVALWPELTGALEESARVCAAGVVRDIRHRRFWPPALRVTWDDFESLFPQGIEACVAAGDFEKRLRT